MVRLFYLIANAVIDIINFDAEISAKRAEKSFNALIMFKDPINYLESSQSKDFAKSNNGKRRLID